MTTNRFLRRPEVESRTGLSRSTIYAAMDRGTFPRPRRIGKRAAAWREDDIERWLARCGEANPGDLYAPRRGGDKLADPRPAACHAPR